VLYRHPDNQENAVVDKNDALLMNGILYRVVSEATGRAASMPGHEVAGKTGTPDDFRVS
jgi:membrane peptidoglycan carboxypeptidase